MRTIGSIIKTIRLERGLTQKEFAKKAGISYSYVSLIEQNHKNPSISRVISIFDSLDFPIVLAFYMLDVEAVDADVGEKLAYAVFQNLKLGNIKNSKNTISLLDI